MAVVALTVGCATLGVCIARTGAVPDGSSPGCSPVGGLIVLNVANARGNTGPARYYRAGQLHFELVASVKFFTEFTTFAASLARVAICVADGFDGSALTAPMSASTDDLMALV